SAATISRHTSSQSPQSSSCCCRSPAVDWTKHPRKNRRMPEPTPRVVGGRFYNAGKIHYFDAAGIRLEPGEYVVVQSSRGPELARLVIAPDQVVVDEIDHDNLRPVLRPAGP